jgi:hypothetical protein
MFEGLKMNRLLALVLLFGFFRCATASDVNEVTRYEKELFTPQVLNYFGMGKDRFQSLTSAQKQDLLEAKKALASFLKATQNPDTDVLRFLGKELRDRYKTRNALLSKLFGQETEILVDAVTDFEFQQKGLNLKFYVVLFSEGNLLVREDIARLKKQGQDWKIVGIGGIE